MLRNLLIGLLSLYTVSVNADMYECKPSMENLSTGTTMSIDRHIASVIVLDKFILYASTPNTPYDKCEIKFIKDGQYRNDVDKCFFDEKGRFMFFIEGVNAITLHDCRRL